MHTINIVDIFKQQGKHENNVEQSKNFLLQMNIFQFNHVT